RRPTHDADPGPRLAGARGRGPAGLDPPQGLAARARHRGPGAGDTRQGITLGHLSVFAADRARLRPRRREAADRKGPHGAPGAADPFMLLEADVSRRAVDDAFGQ